MNLAHVEVVRNISIVVEDSQAIRRLLLVYFNKDGDLMLDKAAAEKQLLMLTERINEIRSLL